MEIFRYSEWIHIPAAKYIYRVVHRIMEGDCQYDHGPRPVEVPELWVSKYPVTNAQFKEFLDATGYQPDDSHNFLKHWENGSYPKGQANFPVVWVCQNDAKAYAKWKNARLLHDYEWQYIAAGPKKRLYPWGDMLDKTKCNYSNSLQAVDAYPEGASPFGVMDMCSNAWEWTQDVIDDGMHLFTLLRGGSYFRPTHFWHTDNGPCRTNQFLKFQLLNDGQNRCGTTSFRIAKEHSCNS